MTKESSTHSVFISHAWGGLSDQVTEAITKKFIEKNIPYVLDKNHLGYRGSIHEFMVQLGKADMVIIILSNKYLRSEFCMFELIQIYKNDRLRDRIYPIVLDEVSISKSTDRIELVKYWEDQIEQLQVKLKELHSLSHIEGFTDDLNLYTEIRNNIAKLTSILRDINALNLRMHSDGDFEVLCQSILANMNLPTSSKIAVNEKKLLNSINTSKLWMKWAGLALVGVFCILGIGKFIFGNEKKEPVTEFNIQTATNYSTIADSLNQKILDYQKAGNLYTPGKDCALRAFQQLEKTFPDYTHLATLKKGLINQLLKKSNELVKSNEPFEAQLLAQKIRELDPQNADLTALEASIYHEKTGNNFSLQSEQKTTIQNPGQADKLQPKNESTERVLTNQKNSTPSIELVKKDPETDLKRIEEKKEHKTKTVTVPANSEILLATDEEYSSDERISTYSKYYFRVAKPFYVQGVAAIAAGDKAEVKFTRIKRSDFKKSGSLEFEITKLILADGKSVNLKASSFLLKSSSDTPLKISRGQQFKVKTAEPVSIEK